MPNLLSPATLPAFVPPPPAKARGATQPRSWPRKQRRLKALDERRHEGGQSLQRSVSSKLLARNQMNKKRPGVKIKDVVTGTGDEATRDKTVAVNVRLFLNHGGELAAHLTCGPKMVIDLARRECIAGLRYGIEGMRVGGQRELIISPHLAYGADGVPGHVPPNAAIRAQVELLDVRKPGVIHPEDYPPGKHLFVFHSGEAARNQPRWQFGLDEDGRCGVSITHPIPGMPWRYTRHSSREAKLDAETAKSFFENAFAMPNSFPEDCYRWEEVWSDTTERGNGVIRNNATNIPCLNINVMERGQLLCNFYLAETSRAMIESPLLRFITSLLEADSPRPNTPH